MDMPEDINTTDECKEIQNHVRQINSLLKQIGEKSEQPERRFTASQAQRAIAFFEKNELHDLEKAFE